MTLNTCKLYIFVCVAAAAALCVLLFGIWVVVVVGDEVSEK